MNQEQERISFTRYIVDNLTGLFSHAYFQEILYQEVRKAKTGNYPLSLAFLNLNGFSSYNMAYGYFQGDSLLRMTGEIIRHGIRNTDIACRYKGDEFAVILPQMGPQQALSLMDEIRYRVSQGLGPKGEQTITLSGGIASFPVDCGSGDELIIKAQKALSQAKIRGKNQCHLFTDSISLPQEHQATILMVDDMKCDILYMEEVLAPLNYFFLRASDGMQALSIVQRQKPDLILMDVMMPNMNGYEVCRRLKGDEKTRLIPIILITSLNTLQDKITGIEVGADDYLRKPFQKAELVARVKSLLRVKYLNDHLENQENVIFSLAKAIEAKDKYTIGHNERVTNYAFLLGKRIALDDTGLNALKVGGFLHDIGKIGVPESILNKPGPLNLSERKAIEKHPEVGFTICLPLKDRLGDALSVIRYHHEKLNGSGYPSGLRGDVIPLVARIMAIADIYDALTTDRPYRKRLTREEAFDILKNEAARGLLDQELVRQFEEVIS
ncbi:MAG: HD domain-containing phosphohydrolase [bacterium]